MNEFIATAILLLISFAFGVGRAWRNRGWVRAEATVVAATETPSSDVDAGPPFGDPSGTLATVFDVHVRFSTTSGVTETHVVLDHEPDKTLTLFYDPKNPRSVVLERGMQSEHWWPLALLVGLTALVLLSAAARRW